MSGSIPAWAYRGTKVVCVDDKTPRLGYWSGDPVVAGEVYVIRDVQVWPGGTGVYFVGVKSGPYGFNLNRFKPLTTQQDDISTHFAQYLNAPHKPVREGV